MKGFGWEPSRVLGWRWAKMGVEMIHRKDAEAQRNNYNYIY
ncbi:MAG TPA: hypothetical protein VF490_04450 [Chryseosolibacter sp.]